MVLRLSGCVREARSTRGIPAARDRLRAGRQRRRLQGDALQIRSRRESPHSARQHVKNGRRHERPNAARRLASSRRALAAGRHRTARRPHRPPRKPKRIREDFSLCHRRQLRCVHVANARNEVPLHRASNDAATQQCAAPKTSIPPR